jgi:hypothetical protein
LLLNTSLIVNLLVELLFGSKNSYIREPKGTLVVQQIAKSDTSELIEISIIEKHVAPRKFAITTSSSNFLNIVLDASWQVIMDNRLNITLVYSHTESNGATKDTSFVLNEVFLNLSTVFIFFSGVIRSCGKPVLIQKLRYLICCGPLSSE